MLPKKSYVYMKKSRALKRLKVLSSSSSSSASSIKSTENGNKNVNSQNQNIVKEIEENNVLSALNQQNNRIDIENCKKSSKTSTTSESIIRSCIFGAVLAVFRVVEVLIPNESKPMEIENSNTNPVSLKEKLQDWSINNIFTLRNSTITELLRILYNEGHTDLPRTAETLLKTKKFSNATKFMETAISNNGLYTYFGIINVLILMINREIYKDDKIEILVNIDGLLIYRNSDKQFWPILIKIYHEDYICKPGIVALYCGDSKPKSMDE